MCIDRFLECFHFSGIMMSQTASELSNSIIGLNSTEMLTNAREIMLNKNISRVVALKNSIPVGIVTEKSIGIFVYKKSNIPLEKLKISQVMRSPVFSVDGNTSIKECAKLMLKNDISSLIVNKNDGKYGIITKSDLVKAFSQIQTKKNPISKYMTCKILSVFPSHSVHRVISIMKKNKISRIIVVSESKPVGIITARDIMPLTNFAEDDDDDDGLENTKAGRKLYELGHVILAKDIMKKPISIKQNLDLTEAARLMTERKFSGIPVVDSNSNLVGIITKTDIVKAISAR